MRRLHPSIAALLLLAAPSAHAYTATTSNDAGGPSFQWITATPNRTEILTTGNNVSATITLDRPFLLYGAAWSQLQVTPNGYLSTDLTDTGADNTNDCPLPATPDVGGGRRLYVLHDNLRLPDASSRITYEYFRDSPHPANSCGVHVITWQDVDHVGPTSNDRFSFQALLFDNGDILYQYDNRNQENGSQSTTGLQLSAFSGLSIECNTANSIPGNFAILIEPDTVTVTTATDENNGTGGGSISLREAVATVPDGGKIVFDSSLSGRKFNLSAIGTSLVLSDRLLTIDASDLTQRPAVCLSGGTIFTLDTQSYLGLNGIDLIDSAHAVHNDASTLIACDVEFRDNDGNLGCGVLQENSAQAWLSNCRFLRNTADVSGAGVYMGINTSASFYRCLFRDNESAVSGGALDIGGIGTTAEFEQCEIADNCASGGGGLYIVGAAITISNSTIAGNRATNNGAGVYLASSINAGSLIASQVTMTENHADNLGGAVYEIGSIASTLTLSACTIADNSATTGSPGVHYRDGSPQFAATILAGNKLTDGTLDNLTQIGGTGTAVSFGDNLTDGTDPLFVQPGDQQSADPKLAPLGWYGGFARTRMLLHGSNAIDGAFSGVGPSTDARGKARLTDGNDDTIPVDDIGAVENGPIITITTAQDENDPIASNGAGISLREAIRDAADGGVVRPTLGLSGAVFDFSPGGDLTVNQKAVFVDASNFNLRPRISGKSVGAVIFIQNGANLSFHSCILSHIGDLLFENSSLSLARSSGTLAHCLLTRGGMSPGFSNLSLTDRCKVALDHTHIVQNTTLFSTGGQNIFLSKEATLRAVDSVIGQNSARQGIMNSQGATIIMDRCSVTENEVSQASIAGMVNAADSSSSARPSFFRLSNTTLSDNCGASTGGALRLFGNLGASDLLPLASLRNITLYRNQCSSGTSAGIHVSNARCKLANSILAANRSNSTLANLIVLGSFGSFTSLGGNISDQNLSQFNGTGDAVSTDPRIGDLVYGPNRVLYHLPQNTSPCIDNGINAQAPKSVVDCRNLPRIVDSNNDATSTIDRGATESGSFVFVTNNNSLGAGSFFNAVNLSSNGARVIFSAAVNGQTTAPILAPGVNNRFIDVDASNLSNGFTVDLTGQAFRALTISSTIAPGGVTMDGITFTNATNGAIGAAANVGANATASFVRCRFLNNTATTNPGGAVAVGSNGVGRFVECELAGNTASADDGGGCFLLQRSHAEFIRSTIAENKTPINDGGGIGMAPTASLFLLDSTVAKNIAVQGGGIYAGGADPSLSIDRSTITRNTATKSNAGGGVETPSTGQFVCFRGSIVAENINGNSAPDTRNIDASASATSLGHNLSDTNETTFDQASDKLGVKPRLAPLSHYGGPTRTCPPLATSPAINAGPSNSCRRIDQRGYDGEVAQRDIGAVEAGPSLIVTSLGDNPSPGTLRHALLNITEGGRILFDPALNNATIFVGNTTQLSLVVDKTVMIDATDLPDGITLTEGDPIVNVALNVTSVTDDVCPSLHAVHFTGLNRAISLTNDTLTVTNSSIHNNGGSNGILFNNGGDLLVENCTASGNTSGAFLTQNGGTTLIRHATINQTTGVGVTSNANATTTLFATIIANSSVANFSQSGGGTNVSLGYNLADTNPTAWIGTDISNGTIGLNALADNGGFGLTHLPENTSDAVNALILDNTVCPPPLCDHRGLTRATGGATTIGAVDEFAASQDSDGDGIPDFWENLYGLNPFDPNDAGLDNDDDNKTNLFEYLSGTIPTDITSFFVLTSFNYTQITGIPTNVSLFWQAEPGQTYQVYRSATLDPNPSNWTLRATIGPVAGTLGFWSEGVPGGTRLNFYQIRTSPAPVP
ncbi:MAG: right-handed parallel beta-helix repeat-containing protein [Verrucomicrobiota bacterium]